MFNFFLDNFAQQLQLQLLFYRDSISLDSEASYGQVGSGQETTYFGKSKEILLWYCHENEIDMSMESPGDQVLLEGNFIFIIYKIRQFGKTINESKD